MRALIFLDNASATVGDLPGREFPRFASRALTSMGITPVYYKINGAAPPDTDGYDAICTDLNVDLVIVPKLTAGNRADFSPMFINGANTAGAPIPVFAQSVVSVNIVQTPGLTGSFFVGDLNGTNAIAEFASTGGTCYTYGKRFVLNTALTGSAAAYPLVQGVGAESTAVALAEYTPDGTHWVYYGNNHIGGSWLHLAMQAAINRGILAKPPHPSPAILNWDHINSAGAGSGGGGPDDATYNGAIGDNSIVSVVGDILRSVKAVCYASMSQQYFVSQSNPADMNVGLIEKLVEYQDVFKYPACHDHDSTYLTTGTYLVDDNDPDDARTSQEAKADIDASYQATKTLTEGINCVANTDFAHFAANAVGTHFWELAQNAVDITCDPAGLEAIQGYGFSMARVGGTVDHTSSYPSVGFADAAHWLDEPVFYRGIILINSKDLGASTRGDLDDIEKDRIASSSVQSTVQENQVMYFHEVDFEDPTRNLAGVVSTGDETGRGVLHYQMGANYQAVCPDTFDFGADITKYVPPITGTNL